MSKIIGTGHGDSHDWEIKGTEEMPLRQDRSTLFVCRDCGLRFRHWYHVTPDIFKAMEEVSIPNECKK